MAADSSPAWRPTRPRGRLLAVFIALTTFGVALTACSATDAPATAAGAHAAPAVAGRGATAVPGVVVTADVPYVSRATPQQRLDVCAPAAAADAPRAAVLLIHGGGWAKGDKADVADTCRWLAQSGYVAFNIDYRLSAVAPYPAQPDDVSAALRFLRSADTVRRYELDPTRVGVMGGSAGGNLAARLALHGAGPLTGGDRVAALVDLSGPVDLTADALNAGQAKSLTEYERVYAGCANIRRCPAAAAASPLRDVSADDPPTFIGQASVDYVPSRQGDALRAALEKVGVPVTLEQRPGHYHSFAVLTPKMEADILVFLHRYLGA